MVITGELANSIDAIQANDQKAVEINGRPIRSPPIRSSPIQDKSLNNVTLASSDREECFDLLDSEAYIFRYFRYLRCFGCSSHFFENTK